MIKKKYVLGRNLILYVSLAEFLITTGHIYDYQFGFDFLLLGNILSHVLAPIFFVGIALIIYGMFYKKEYLTYKFSLWDAVAIFFILMTTQDFWYTIVTPHPLFHDRYWI
ncbi:MAG: hypothetical protein ACI9H6_000760 [Patiriisocius sp.]|jgi:hypothetical protein